MFLLQETGGFSMTADTRSADAQVEWFYGRAELMHSAVSEIGLKVKVDNKPLRHANITGWLLRLVLFGQRRAGLLV